MRSRQRSSIVTLKGLHTWNSGVLDNYVWNYTVGQKILDEVHPWRSGTPAPGVDVGGPLWSERYDFTHNSPQGVTWDGYSGVGEKYTGDLLPYVTSGATWTATNGGTWAAPTPISDGALDALGTSAISRCAPTNTHAQTASALGELLRDGLPAGPGLQTMARRFDLPPNVTRLRRAGSAGEVAGGEYLNVEFGVKPLMSDITRFVEAVRDSDKILSQYQRDSGRVVRRRYAFPVETESSETVIGTQIPVGLPTYAATNGGGLIKKSTIVERRRWFSGAFTYFVQPASDAVYAIKNAAQKANHLLGIGLTPATVYNLTPWSWGLDWFSNMGDVMNNISMYQQDGLLLKYGYMMDQTIQTTTYSNVGCTTKSPVMTLAITQEFKYTLKRRRAATPFGFGLTFSDFSPRQVAIIAALGLSRSGKYTAM